MNGTPVEYDKLLKTVATPLPRTRKKAREPKSLPFEHVDLDKLSQMAFSKEIPDANRQAFRPGERGDRALRRACTRRRQRDSPVQCPAGNGRYGRTLSPRLARNFRRAGRLKNRSRTSICVPVGAPISRTDSILPPERALPSPRSKQSFASRQPETRNACNARKRLAAKAHRTHASKIGAGPDLLVA